MEWSKATGNVFRCCLHEKPLLLIRSQPSLLQTYTYIYIYVLTTVLRKKEDSLSKYISIIYLVICWLRHRKSVRFILRGGQSHVEPSRALVLAPRLLNSFSTCTRVRLTRMDLISLKIIRRISMICSRFWRTPSQADDRIFGSIRAATRTKVMTSGRFEF